MSVKLFFPKISDNEEEFKRFLQRIVEGRCRFAKNKDGSKFCIFSLKYDENIRCAYDLIELISGQIVGEVLLKPKIHINTQTHRVLDNIKFPPSEGVEGLVFTTHVDEDKYYVQLLSENEEKILMTNKLKEIFEDLTIRRKYSYLNISDVKVNKIYATLYHNEPTYHRVRIIEKMPSSSKCRVMFIDYGNVEVIDSSCIVSINEELQNKLPLVHCCKIEAVDIIDLDRHASVALEVINRRLKARLLWKYCDIYQVNRVVALDYLDFTTITYRDYLVGQGIAKLQEQYQTNGVESIHDSLTNSIPNLSCPLKKIKSAVLTHYENNNEFYILFDDSQTDLNLSLINNLISKLIDKPYNVEDSINPDVSNDGLYICKYSIDKNYYRCKIIQHDESDGRYKIQYIDFGNSEWIKDKTDLKLLTPFWCSEAEQLSKIEYCSKKCSFDEDLCYLLDNSNLSQRYFQDNFIVTETPLTVHYTNYNNQLVVSNFYYGAEDLISSFEKIIDDNNCDKYILTCLDSIESIWFVLVKSHNKSIQQKLESVHKLCSNSNNVNFDCVESPMVNEAYLVITDNDKLLRARYIGIDKRALKMYFRDIDSGYIELIRYDLVYHLPSHIKSISGFAKAFQLKKTIKNLCKSDLDLLRHIKRIIGKNECSLRLMNDEETIVDVVVRGKSLLKQLIKNNFIERMDIQLPDIIGDSNIPILTTRDMANASHGSDSNNIYNIDLSTRSIDDILILPSRIISDNAKIRSLRHFFLTSRTKDSNLCEELDKLQQMSVDSNELIELSRNVQQLESNYNSLKQNFTERLCNAKIKRSDVQDLVEERSKLCEDISCLYNRVSSQLKDKNSVVDDSQIQEMSEKLDAITSLMYNLRKIFHEAVSSVSNEDEELKPQNATIHSEETGEISNCSLSTLANRINDLVKHDTAVIELENTSEPLRCITDQCYQLLNGITNKMCCTSVPLNFNIDSFENVSAPLVDALYNLHSAQIDEIKAYTQTNRANELYDIFSKCYSRLHQYNSDIQTIINRYKQLTQLYKDSCAINNTDDTFTLVISEVELNNKRVLASRSALRRAIANLEDAEDAEDPDQAEKHKSTIERLTSQMHQVLANINLSVSQMSELLELRPEVQITNTTLLLPYYNQTQLTAQDSLSTTLSNAIVNLWDIKYFQLDPVVPLVSSMSISNNYRYYYTTFKSTRQLLLQLKIPSSECTRQTLSNTLLLRSLSNNSSASQPRTISLLPINFVFLSSSSPQFQYMLLDNAKYISSSDDIQPIIPDIITFTCLVRDMIELVISLWHHGFIYSTTDFADDNFLMMFDKQSSNRDCDNEEEPIQSPKLYLPLPINAILSREIITTKSFDSITVFLANMYRCITKTCNVCVKYMAEITNDAKCKKLLVSIHALSTCKNLRDLEEIQANISASIELMITQKHKEAEQLQKKQEDTINDLLRHNGDNNNNVDSNKSGSVEDDPVHEEEDDEDEEAVLVNNESNANGSNVNRFCSDLVNGSEVDYVDT